MHMTFAYPINRVVRAGPKLPSGIAVVMLFLPCRPLSLQVFAGSFQVVLFTLAQVQTLYQTLGYCLPCLLAE